MEQLRRRRNEEDRRRLPAGDGQPGRGGADVALQVRRGVAGQGRRRDGVDTGGDGVVGAGWNRDVDRRSRTRPECGRPIGALVLAT